MQGDDRRAILLVFSVAIGAGLVTGMLGSAFRTALDAAGQFREVLVTRAHDVPGGFFAVVAGTALAVMAARFLVMRYAPIAAGSGVQHVEAVIRGEAPPASAIVVPVKFVGGILAIGAGMPLGREGPTVQMGSVIAHELARRFLPDRADREAVLAAGAGAGLGVAFNTPVGAAVFVFEELTRTFVPLQVLTTLAAAAVAMAVMHFALGDAQLFHAGVPVEQPLNQLPVHFVLGALMGFAGAWYSTITLAFLNGADRLQRIPSIIRAGIIGAVVGVVGWRYPHLIGGGEELVQSALSTTWPASILGIVLAVRLILGPLSYAAGVPGGLFAPLLVVGAGSGALFHAFMAPVMPGLAPSSAVLSVVAMAAIFTAVVRAPLTGVVMTIEMTGRADCAMAMLTASLAATLVASLIGSRPIYDILRERMLAAPVTHRSSEAAPPQR
ncbi:MAG: ClC family H(+)/Cl(-) exchange transporter [Hyphomicrobiales bacterium]